MSNPSGFLPYKFQFPETRTALGWSLPKLMYDDLEGTLEIEVQENLPAFSPDEPRRLRLSIDRHVSFRVMDERELSHYWSVRSKEGIEPATSIYRINKSDYLDEAKANSLVSDTETLFHLLFAGEDACVEVIADEYTQIEVVPYESGIE